MDGKIVALVATKGGSGPSTLALTLAHAKPFQCMQVAILEADRQGSLSRWWADRQAAGRNGGARVYPFYDDRAEPLIDTLAELAAGHDLVLIDCPGESVAYVKTKVALAFSDVVLIPIRQSDFDMDSAITHVLPLLNEAREAGGRGTKYFLLPVMVHHRAGLEKTLGTFEGTDAKVLPAILPYRKAFTEFSSGGCTLQEYWPTVRQKNSRGQAKKAMGDGDTIAAELARELGIATPVG